MKLVPRNNGHVQAISYAQHEQCQHGRGMKELETEIFELHDKKPEDVQLAIFLQIVGDDTMAVHNTFAFMEAASYKLKPVLSKFEACCSPQKNIVYKCYNFCKSTQAPGEPIDAFVISLLQKVKSTDFGAQTVSLIRD